MVKFLLHKRFAFLFLYNHNSNFFTPYKIREKGIIPTPINKLFYYFTLIIF